MEVALGAFRFAGRERITGLPREVVTKEETTEIAVSKRYKNAGTGGIQYRMGCCTPRDISIMSFIISLTGASSMLM